MFDNDACARTTPSASTGSDGGNSAVAMVSRPPEKFARAHTAVKSALLSVCYPILLMLHTTRRLVLHGHQYICWAGGRESPPRPTPRGEGGDYVREGVALHRHECWLTSAAAPSGAGTRLLRVRVRGGGVSEPALAWWRCTAGAGVRLIIA